MKPLIPAIIAALLPLAALAEGQVSVQDAYARAANPKSGAAFMVIANAGPEACTFMGATTDAADKAELHTSRDEGGMMKMVAIDPIEIGPDESHALTRGGDHIMLMGLKAPLKDGETVNVTLTFEKAGDVTVTVEVLPLRAEGPDCADAGQ